MARRERVVRMSVEVPLWRALAAYRVLTMIYGVLLFLFTRQNFERPGIAIAFLAVMSVWTLATLHKVTGAASCTKGFLVADLTIALTGIMLTPLADAHAQQVDGPTLPSIWTAGSVLAFAIKGGWRWAGVASSFVAVANIVERGEPSRDTFHNVLLVWVASIAIGYVVEVARASERTLARALEIEAATRERERLARDIHDSVLQVLAMVQRRGTALGGEAAELGRMAGEQEVALRTLVAGGLVTASRVSEDESQGAVVRVVEVPDDEPARPHDLRTLLAPHAGSKVTLSEPGAPVLLDAPAARELAAAVGAALDNVRRHAGEDAQAWILVEDWPDEVVVTVRDDGPGIPDGRLAQAEGEGRMGVAMSIRGRLRDLGGTAELISVPGQGTEVELKVPRGKAGT
ncbi:MacS family sensor histidine kinase [Streptomyces sp. NPDC002187]|uniref:MacS family sensor histidine kinase n=1 Tax=Streptomyces sp. NPDC002187 TaxID=3364637 RepID=UPI003692585A